jgi:hypothetical protein
MKKETSEPTPFQRFETFTKKLISVPKKEIEKRQRAYDKAKAKRHG